MSQKSTKLGIANDNRGFVLIFFALLLPILIFVTQFGVEYFMLRTAKDEVYTSMMKALNDSVHFFSEKKEDLLSHLKAKIIFDLNPINIKTLNNCIEIRDQEQKERTASEKLYVHKCEIRKYINEKIYLPSKVNFDGNLSVSLEESHYSFQLLKNKYVGKILEELRELGITTYNLKYDDMVNNVVINDFSCNHNYVADKTYKRWTYKSFISDLLHNDMFEGIFWDKEQLREYEIPSISIFLKMNFDDMAKLTKAGVNIFSRTPEDLVKLESNKDVNFYKFIGGRLKIEKKIYSVDLEGMELNINDHRDYKKIEFKTKIEVQTPFSKKKVFNVHVKVKFYDNAISKKNNSMTTTNIGIAVPVKTDESRLNVYHILMNCIAGLIDKLDPENASVAVVPYESKVKLSEDLCEKYASDINVKGIASEYSTILSGDFLLSSDAAIPCFDSYKIDLGENTYNIPKSSIKDLQPCKKIKFSFDGAVSESGRINSITKNFYTQGPSVFISDPYESGVKSSNLSGEIRKYKYRSEHEIDIPSAQVSDIYSYVPNEKLWRDDYNEQNIMEINPDMSCALEFTDDQFPGGAAIFRKMNLCEIQYPVMDEELLYKKSPYNPFPILRQSPPSTAAMYLRLLNSTHTFEESNFINLGALWAWRMTSDKGWDNNADKYSRRVVILVVNRDVNFKANEHTAYGIANDQNLLVSPDYKIHDNTVIQCIGDQKNSFGVDVEHLINLTIKTIKNMIQSGVMVYVVEVVPMEHSSGFPKLKNYLKNVVESEYGQDTVHFQRCAIENNLDSSRIEDTVRMIFSNIEEDLHLKNTFKSANYHSTYLVIDDDD